MGAQDTFNSREIFNEDYHAFWSTRPHGLTTETQTTAHQTAASQSSTCAAEDTIDPTTGSASTRTSAALKVNPAELSLQMSPAKHLEKLISHSRKYSSESILVI